MNARYVRGKKPHFGPYPEAKKGVARAQVRSKGSPEEEVLCVVMSPLKAPQRPQKMQIPRGYQKKCLLCRKSAILPTGWKFHV